MNKIVMMLTATCLATVAYVYKAATPIAAQKDEKPPLMLSFTDLKWTELPERKGMQFSLISGDPNRSVYATAQGSGGHR